MNYAELKKRGRELLERAGLEDPEGDAKALLLGCFHLSLTDYALHMHDEVPDENENTYLELIARRAEREPVQYILGTAPFLGFDFVVTPDVLIPRFDTEILVEYALGRLHSGDEILDLCTGSGCVIISLLRLGPEGMSGTGSDLSENALLIAEKNAGRLETGVNFVHSDLFEQIDGRYDMIVSNPPYIRSEEVDRLDREVREYEPRMALDGAGDGLYFYRKIISGADAHLKDSGVLAVEIGYDQGEAVSRLMRESGLKSVCILQDLAGRDRVVFGEKHE
ncbi:MAG: peptide chain release factor N(5)-glutamine methyltransferase [Lachnospiraceae bacterium]|nr:peptide chain release factor N(5)-glutamine methyltransferase [Lachnospiraceae bacterium]